MSPHIVTGAETGWMFDSVRIEQSAYQSIEQFWTSTNQEWSTHLPSCIPLQSRIAASCDALTDICNPLLLPATDLVPHCVLV